VLVSVGKGDRAAHLRPTTDRVRENIFNILLNGGYGDPVQGARVLDLFAGTGALGLEAMSRGADEVVFVDDGAYAAGLIRRNIGLCHLDGRARLDKRDATRPGKWDGVPFSLVFLDPPYGRSLGQVALAATARGGWLAEDSLVVWEEGAQQMPPEGFEMLDARRYGDTWVHVLRYAQ